jgi:DHA2 family multidrug resistance protein-like MFS transporter
MMRAMSAPGAVPHPAAVHADGLPVPRRYWAMAAIALAIAMSVLDSSIANVALPTIARDFGATPAASIWVINAYQLAILVLLLPLASLGEIVGYRRVAQTGLAVFTLASLACAFAPTLAALSIARIVQGFGAAGIMSVGPALVRFTYPHRYLGRAIGINAFVIATSAALGPTIAAAVLAVAHWRWLFGINVPIGLITICIALASLPETERTPRPLNYAGAALCAGAFGLLVSGLQSFAHQGSRALALLQVACGGALAWLLVRHERPRVAPLIPFDLLRIRILSLSLLTSVCAFMAQTAALVALPFEIQRLGHSAVTTGLLMTPWPLALAVAAPLAGHLTDRYAAGALGACGLLVLAAGLALLALLPVHAAEGSVVWRMMLCGLGFGFFQAPNNRTILASAPRQRSGAAGGLLGVGRLLGQALGAAAVAILFGIYAAAGSNIALWAGALLALAGAAFSAGRLSRGNEAHA